MTKLVACKTCKKEVAKNAKACPHCGQKNPTVNYGAGFAVFVFILLVLGFFVFDDGDDEQKAIETTNEEKQLERQDQTFTSKITVSDYAYTMRDEPAVSINLIKNDNEYIDLIIIKSEIKEGFYSKLGKEDAENWQQDKFNLSLYIDGVLFKRLTSKNKSNFIELKITEYNQATRKAEFEISFELTNTENNKQVADSNKLAFSIDGDNFDLLKKDFSNREDKIKKTSIKTVSRKNIEAVIASLKKHYNVDAGNNEYEAGLDMETMCWNDRACEVFAKTVQIQATHRSVEALTSSQVTPQYYQQVCSAIMIALTGANKALVEQQIPQFFNHASQNGRSKWEVLGIEITVSPDSSGLLGCDFYKPK